MRRGRWLSLLAAALVVACGGGGSGTSSGPPQLGALKTAVQVTFWHALSGNLQTELTTLTDQFNSSQSNVHVNLVAKGAYTDLNKAVLTDLAAGQAPDLAQCVETDAASYSSSKALADLTPYINAADGFSSSDLKDIFPVMLNAARINGTYYQFPFNKSTTVVYYNQDLFAAKGITSPPSTWTEFFSDAAKLADPATGVTGAEGPSLDTFLSMLYEYGGQMYDSPTNPTKTTINSADGIQAMTLWYNAIKSGAVKPIPAGNFADQVDFQNGKTAMYISTQVSYQFIVKPIGTKFKFAEASFPAGDKGVKDEMFGANLCVFNKSSNDVQHGAVVYMKYLTSAANTATWAQNTSYMPVRDSAFKSLSSGFYAQNPSQAIGAGMLSRGELIVLPSVPTSNEQRDALTTEINNIAALRKDPKTGLDDAATKMNDILATG
ncbi:MAG TPA: ABC transporter substrate-binding protein [Candidatus Dormibacteraeota bacterium]|nr:ABC transporter substrate-binding protein [Candidatus Dormibacteraeota bacterium]